MRLLRSGGRRDERGAVAIVVALCVTLLCVAASFVLDFGLMRVDRQVHKSAADDAVRAGIHGLDLGDSSPHSYAGVCAAVRFLKRTDTRFAGINEGVGWTDGNGLGTASGCTNASLRGRTCVAADKTTWARFVWTGTLNGKPITARIESGYLLTSSGWVEDTLSASTADEDDGAGGCNQLAVTISHARKPGLGSLATNSDMTTSIRSVGRVVSAPGGSAPAMLLLKQSGCRIIQAGSSSGGFVKVKGAVSSTPGLSQPGTIHSDSAGGGDCGSNDALFMGAKADGIVAYAAPLEATPTLPDVAKPGQITAFAAALGVSDGVLRDGTTYVCGAASLDAPGCNPGTAVLGRGRVYRRPVDERYLSAVKGMAADAVTAAATRTTWTQLNSCDPTAAERVALAALTAADMLHVNCTHNLGFNPAEALTINAGKVYFAGKVNPSANLELANAQRVYIHGSSADALSLGSSGAFRMNTSGNLAGTECAGSPSALGRRATLVVRNGMIRQTGSSTLQLCRTTVLMMSGDATSTDRACLPASPLTTPPDVTNPCGATLGVGTGQLRTTGGTVDWTAPNTMDQTLNSDGSPLPAATAAWARTDGPEDLAFWSESANGPAASSFSMAGGSSINLVGVLMVPNAQPFSIAGGGAQDLTDAQYIVSSINLDAQTTITMSVDPNAAVTLPDLNTVGLVR